MRKLSRRHQCSVSGCRSRETYLCSRRDDVNGQPLYLCADCIKDMYASLSAVQAEEAKAQKQVEAEIEKRTKAAVEEKLAEAEAPAEPTTKTATKKTTTKK